MPDAPPEQLDRSSYDVLRGRLDAQARELRERLEALNAKRKEAFGSVELALAGTSRVTTAHACVPRDIVAVGDRVLMGFNVHFGLKSTVDLGDVFACYRQDDEAVFHDDGLGLLENESFRKDFTDLMRFYKDARFTKFFRRGPHVYMKFRTGRTVDDFKAFKWAFAPGESGQEGEGLAYLGNRSDHEVTYPPQHDFAWKRVTRDMQTGGRFPHYSIEDLVFVETTGGDLTIKVENNTETGEGILAEPVDEPDQGLDDADVLYVVEGPLVLLRIRPYREKAWRHFVFNTKLGTAVRADGLGTAAVLLPEDQGVMTADGVYLATGEKQVFAAVADLVAAPGGLTFDRRVVSPNGEDFLYVFYQRERGVYVLFAYNLIARQVAAPIVCNGYAFRDDGRLLLFKSPEGAEPQKHHAVQNWTTPFVGPDHVAPAVAGGGDDNPLKRIGNRDVVRAMAEARQVLGLATREDLYQSLYADLVKQAGDLLDTYFWLGEDAAARVAEPLAGIRDAAAAAVGEYEKLTRQRRETARAVAEVRSEVDAAIASARVANPDEVGGYVETLAALRAVRGEVIGLRELRHVDPGEVEAMEAEVVDQTEAVSQKTLSFLLRDDALDPYRDRVRAQDEAVGALATAAEAEALGDEVAEAAGELELLIDVVNNLDIDDATQRTAVVEAISEVFSRLNATRSRLRARRQELGQQEGAAEFASRLKLLEQSITNALELADTPEKADASLAKLMVQVEELEASFGGFDDFVGVLIEKREEVLAAFEQRRLALVEQKNQRADTLARAAERILGTVRSRVESMDAVEEINAYFAGDLMVEKLRDLADELGGMDDRVREGDLRAGLKAAKEDAVRRLKDRLDLQGGGRDTIRFGRHTFAISTQPIDLTLVHRDDTPVLHVTGTQFFEEVADPRLRGASARWDQALVSESASVYRAEYLAYLMLEAGAGTSVEAVQAYMAPRYAEGYVKGVHDADAAKILSALVELRDTLGTLRFSAPARVLAQLWWEAGATDDERKLWHLRLANAAAAASPGPASRNAEDTEAQRHRGGTEAEADAADRGGFPALEATVRGFAEEVGGFTAEQADEAVAVLAAEVGLAGIGGEVRFAASGGAVASAASLRETAGEPLAAALEAAPDAVERFRLARTWDRDPEVALRLAGGENNLRVLDASPTRSVENLVGDHPRIRGGELTIDYPVWVPRMRRFATAGVAAFEAFSDTKHEVLKEARDQMRLDTFKPKVLTSFVRNRLLDEVFLPLIGDNLAKQIGTAGADTRTDRMGLLLLISPPGYGKTTLMEYVCARLGMVFLKINGPALGHGVTSLDPAEATNAAAKEELQKLNLGFEMGDNVMVYVDDIQHTNPAFLQKFISLCDAQRRIEGVRHGKPKAYDFRGRRVAVVMAGNPYTESGEAFRIPDMLSNRADTYNLGDIIGAHGDAFEMSYLENALTSNPALNPLATATRDDVHRVIRLAGGASPDGVEFDGSFPPDELAEMVEVVRKLARVRDVILKVNLAYIASAGQDDDYRTEPPFLLQGSYRNMNRIAEKVSAVMNDAELRELIVSAYEQDAQTLTTGAEANLLKFRELVFGLTPEQEERWVEIKSAFVRNNSVRALGG
ncbi:DNA repair ATPase, partial [Phycisphaera mikurensis]